MTTRQPTAHTTGRRPGIPGRALMLYTVDVDPPDEQRFEAWYTHEHLPERVGVPGFLRGRRYVRLAGPGHQHLTVYDARDATVFSSPEYLARLDNPTPLTREIVSRLRDPRRVVLEVLFSHGAATGRQLAVLNVPGGSDGELLDWVTTELAPVVLADGNACGLHLAVTDPEATRAKAATAEGRQAAEAADANYVLLLDGLRHVTEQAATAADLCRRQGYATERDEPNVYEHLVTLLPG